LSKPWIEDVKELHIRRTVLESLQTTLTREAIIEAFESSGGGDMAHKITLLDGTLDVETCFGNAFNGTSAILSFFQQAWQADVDELNQNLTSWSIPGWELLKEQLLENEEVLSRGIREKKIRKK